jgi:intracellular septation protein
MAQRVAGSPPDTGTIVGPLIKRTLTELGPVFVFFGTFLVAGIRVATAAFMAAAVISVIASWIERRALPTIPVILAGIILVCGALTLILSQDDYIKMQPTVANGLFAIALAAGRYTGRDLLKRAFSPGLRLTEEGWAKLTWRSVAYLTILTIANELVWRSFTTETWMMFKTFGIVPLNILFALAQISLLRSHWARAP